MGKIRSLCYRPDSANVCMFAFARNVHDERPPILLIIPIRSIVQEQLMSNEFELKAVEQNLQDDVLKNVRDGNVEVLNEYLPYGND